MFEYFLRLDGLLDHMKDPIMLPIGAPSQMLPSQHKHKDDVFSATHQKGVSLSTDSHLRSSRELLEIYTDIHWRGDSLGMLVTRYLLWPCVFLVLLISFAFYYKSSVVTGNSVPDVESSSSTQPVSSKRKKSRKSGKNITVLEEIQPYEKVIRRWLNLNSLLQSETDGRTIGKLFVSKREIAKGSKGIVVYEGAYEGRKVVVKVLVQAHHDLRSIRILIVES
ncbi:hypothetical protein SOVF_056910 [Spinacia oleracea]|nr:hypothetical protein SOVF_056910 [Spinacia oleracea]